MFLSRVSPGLPFSTVSVCRLGTLHVYTNFNRYTGLLSTSCMCMCIMLNTMNLLLHSIIQTDAVIMLILIKLLVTRPKDASEYFFIFVQV